MLFVGINPGIRSSLTGHHFAGFSNRFWKLLYESRLVPEPIGFEDDDRLPEWGYGITNIVARPTPGIDTLRPEEYVAGRAILRRKVARYKPAVVAMVGVTVFRAMYPGRKGPVALDCSPRHSAQRRSSFCRTRAAATRTSRTPRCWPRSRPCDGIYADVQATKVTKITKA